MLRPLAIRYTGKAAGAIPGWSLAVPPFGRESKPENGSGTAHKFIAKVAERSVPADPATVKRAAAGLKAYR